MIYCANNNRLYSRAADVCKDLNLDKGLVSRVLAGKQVKAGVYLIEEVTDTTPEALETVRRWMLYNVYKIVL